MAYKTAKELKIKDWEYQGLISLVTKLPLVKYVEDYTAETDKKTEGRVFNMDVAMAQYDCGTVCCIGGFLITEKEADISPEEASDYVHRSRSPALNDLFYPRAGIDYELLDTEQAVEAIENFLNTGDPDWKSVVRPDQIFY